MEKRGRKKQKGIIFFHLAISHTLAALLEFAVVFSVIYTLNGQVFGFYNLP